MAIKYNSGFMGALSDPEGYLPLIGMDQRKQALLKFTAVDAVLVEATEHPESPITARYLLRSGHTVEVTYPDKTALNTDLAGLGAEWQEDYVGAASSAAPINPVPPGGGSGR